MPVLDKTTDPLESYGNRKVFVPMSIEQNSSTKRSYFLSPTKAALGMGLLVPIVPVSFYAYSSSNGNWIVFGVAVLIYIFIYTLLLRFVVLEERRLKKMVRTLDANKISPTSYFWGIDEIADDGIIHYRYNFGLQKAVIVKICRGSIIGRDETFAENYADANLRFIRGLLKNNFSYMKYSQLENSKMPDGLVDYIKRLEAIDDVAQRAVLRMNIETISEFTKGHKRVINDYYVIYNKDVRIMKSFKTVVRDLIVASYSHIPYFDDSHILDSDEVVEFISNNLNVKTVQKRGYIDNTEKEPFEKYGRVIRLLDSEGKDGLVDFGIEVKESTDFEVIKGPRGKSLDDLDKEARRRGKITDPNASDLFDEDDFFKNEPLLKETEETEELEEIIYVDEDGNIIDPSELDGDAIYEELQDETRPTPSSKIDNDSNLFDLE